MLKKSTSLGEAQSRQGDSLGSPVTDFRNLKKKGTLVDPGLESENPKKKQPKQMAQKKLKDEPRQAHTTKQAP